MTTVTVLKKRVRGAQEPTSFKYHLLRVLAERLHQDCAVLSIPHGTGLPGIAVIFRGVTHYLECRGEAETLSPQRRDMFVKMRKAGARVEVVRNTTQALTCCAEFGVPIREAQDLDIRTIFKIESGRKPGSTWGKAWQE
jgi:hypothetical protein